MKEPVQFVDRHGTSSLKWDILERVYGEKDMISMWVADMDFRCPECIHQALRGYMESGVYGYATLANRFYDAFLQWEQQRHGYTAGKAFLRYAPGVVPAVYWCVAAMTAPGDRVLVLPPVYYPFFHAVEDNGRVLVESELRLHDGVYEMDFADMEEKIVSQNVKMLIFCSPHNPVGRVWRREELEALTALCQRHGVILVSDEIHQDFALAGSKHIPMGLLSEQNVVMLTAPSKTFNLAGLHNAVAILPDETLRAQWDAYTKKLHINSGNSFAYVAGEAAYLHGGEWLDQVKEIIRGNYLFLKDTLLSRFPALRAAPLEGTYLMWVDFGAYLKEEELKDFFEKRCKIALDYGSWFHGRANTWVRFNLATSRELVEKAADAILRALATREQEG